MTAHRLAFASSGTYSGHSSGGRAFVRQGVALGVLGVALLAASAPAYAKTAAHAARPATPAKTAAAPAAGDGDKVAQALAQGDISTAQALAEAAVTANPRAAGVRVVLGRVYLRAGRFESAASMLADARTLGDASARTALGLALAQIASGHGADAVAVLDGAHDAIPVSDYGLALAMAGQTARGVAILGDALRGGDQSPKLRQNLAYSFALDGRWGEARLMAAFDTPAEKLDARLSQWADTAQPDAVRKRVANLIGVPLREDPGVPLSLALAPAVPAADSAGNAAVPASAVQTVPAANAASPAVVAQGGATPAPAEPARLADAKPETTAPAQPAVAAAPTPVAQALAEAAPAAAPAPAAATLAVKTDANGELPAVDHAPAAAPPALAVATPVPHSGPNAEPTATTLVLHRADTTRLVGVALAHADVVAARHARLQARRHGLEHAALAAGVEPRATAPAPSPAPEVAQSAAPSAPAKLAVAETAARPAAHQHKPHVRKDVAVAEAAPAREPIALPAPKASGAATHLVQLGSFSTQQNAEHARQTFLARDPALGHRQFIITQAFVKGHNFWRVAVMGFDASSAGQTCSAIRQHGGACFAYAAGHLPGGQALAMATPARQDQLARR